MSKLKIEKGASKVRRASLKATIDGTVADDLELMGKWSENDSSYLVNILLGFAIAQSEEFQKYKTELGTTPSLPPAEEKSTSETARRVLPASSPATTAIAKGVNA